MRPLYFIYGFWFCIFYSAIIFWPGDSLSLFQNYGFFFFLGLIGALVANSTGAGGGVIFIPFFTAIGFTSVESVGTSMAIQCFGMTAGAVAWLNNIQKQPESYACKLVVIQNILIVTGLVTMIGVLTGQYLIAIPEIEISLLFRIFSIIFGLILFLYTWRNRFIIVEETHKVSFWAWFGVVIVCFLGGILTSWISIGVGECIALLLIFLRFSPALAVAVGVFTSAISVLVGIVQHLFVLHSVSFEVVLFAGQAALIGGYLARHITVWLGSFQLKLFFAGWIFISGIFMG